MYGVGYGLSVLDAEVWLGVGMSRVVFPIVHPYDGESTVGPVGAVFEHERGQVR